MPRITAYKQLEYSDCGITCIRIIAKYYGKRIPLKTLREICDVGRIGISLKDILDCTKVLGFKSAAVKVSELEVYRMPLPAILYWEQKHYVVLHRIDVAKKRFYLADPAQGEVAFNKEEFIRYWMGENKTGLSIVLSPLPVFYAKEYDKNNDTKEGLLKLLKSAIRKYKKGFFTVVFFTLIAIIADVALPMVFRRTIDEGIENKDIGLVWLLVFGQLCIFIGNYIANNITDIVLTKMGLRISINMINEYLIKLIQLPMSFFDRKVNSDLIQKIDDQNRVKNFLVNMPETTFFTFINLIVFSGLLVYYNYIIFLIVLASTLLSFAWMKIFMQKRREIDYSYFSYSSMNRNNIYELINGMPEIKINNAQQNRVSIWNNIQEKINTLSLKSAFINLSINSGNVLFSRLKDISITGICATLVIQDQMTIGMMMTVSYIVGQLTRPVSNLINSVNAIQDASISYERLDEIINQPHTDHPIDHKTNIQLNDTTLYFNNISFKYPGSYSPYVITNLTTIIPRNKITAIVGASGSGKTTLIKLMLGFYAPQYGEIHVGNHNMSEIDNNQWLKHCGVVMQSGYIFSGSILDNIALSDPEPDVVKAKEAAKIACIDSFFEELPMGYYTKIGVNGVELSGGQKQRLYIARAIYKNPALLFLDEATSSLDANNERNIINNMMQYYRERTVVIAAHRLSTVKNADKIIYIENGEIKEEGTHDELIASKGFYYKLVKNQLELGD